jgi:hypothetical protein
MKLGMIIYNNELQIKFEFRHFDQYLTVMALGLSEHHIISCPWHILNFHGNFSYP